MTHRHTADTITDDDLDALYEQLDRVRAMHHPTGVVAAAEHGNPPDCAVCGENCWPCPTYQAVSEPAPTLPAAPTPVPCPACRRADQAGLAETEQHDDCANQEA